MSMGAPDRSSELFAMVYAELKAISRKYMRGARDDQSLQPTALVHEAYLRLAGELRPLGEQVAVRRRGGDPDAAHPDRARAEGPRQKRPPRRLRVTLADDLAAGPDASVDLLAIDEALERLAARRPRQSRIAELRLFAGMQIDEIAASAAGLREDGEERLEAGAGLVVAGAARQSGMSRRERMPDRRVGVVPRSGGPAARRAASLPRACMLESRGPRGGAVPPRPRGQRRAWAETGALGHAALAASTRQSMRESIGPYRLLRKLGEGGMGVVFLAEQEQPIRRQVAVKLIKLGIDTRRMLARFESERQALALMSHPNIAQVHDAGITDRGRSYFVMEYVEGERITDFADRQGLDLEQRLALFVQVCDGVQHAHHKGVIHRDIKPSNVLVTSCDGRPLPKIIDFGIAKAIDRSSIEHAEHTLAGELLGTPGYMSPEQARPGDHVDSRTDVYSLGALLYELVTGRPPFEPTELQEAGGGGLARILEEREPVRPSVRNRGSARSKRLRGDLDWIIGKAMAKEPDQRYGSPAELKADIERHLRNEPVEAGPPTRRYRIAKFARRHRAPVSVAFLILALLVAFSVTMTIQARRVAVERDRATLEAERAKRESAESAETASFLAELLFAWSPGKPGEDNLEAIPLREFFDIASSRVEAGLQEQPALRGRLLAIMAEAIATLGEESKADALRRLADDLLDADDPESLAIRHDLARWYVDNFTLDRAETVIVDLLATRRRVLGENHVDVHRTEALLGTCRNRQQRMDESRSAPRESDHGPHARPRARPRGDPRGASQLDDRPHEDRARARSRGRAHRRLGEDAQIGTRRRRVDRLQPRCARGQARRQGSWSGPPAASDRPGLLSLVRAAGRDG